MKRTNDQKTWIDISSSALLYNISSVRSAVAPSKVMAVVKANAYGHGTAVVAKAIQTDADWFGVDSLDEAVILRKNGIKKPILIIGYVPPARLSECAKLNCSISAYSTEMLKALKSCKGRKGSLKIHLKIETGTTRLGLCGAELEAFVKAVKKIPVVTIEGAYTHYANIEDTTDSSYAVSQLTRFRKELGRLRQLGIEPSIIHTAASAAAILYPEARFDCVRLGIALYGHWPSKETNAVARRQHVRLELKPALMWKTVVAQVKQVTKGTPVSYGLTESVTRLSKLAVLPVGYWDGYDRGLSSVGYVLIKSRRAKIMGRVCMNMMIVDVTDIPNVRSGDEAVLIGAQGDQRITAEDVASKIGTIQYELLTRINPLIERRLVG